MTTATIPSRTTAQVYTVSLHDSGATSCTCPAGIHGKPCWHVKALRTEATRRAELASAEHALASLRSRADCHPECASYYAPLIRQAEARVAALAL